MEYLPYQNPSKYPWNGRSTTTALILRWGQRAQIQAPHGGDKPLISQRIQPSAHSYLSADPADSFLGVSEVVDSVDGFDSEAGVDDDFVGGAGLVA